MGKRSTDHAYKYPTLMQTEAFRFCGRIPAGRISAATANISELFGDKGKLGAAHAIAANRGASYSTSTNIVVDEISASCWLITLARTIHLD